MDRRWEAPPGTSLLCSLLLTTDAGAASAHQLVQAVALAAAEACEDVAGVAPTLKWPNDLLVGQRKLAGILAEAVGPSVGTVVVGIGLNVNWEQHDVEATGRPSTALNLEAGRDIDRERLLQAFLTHLAATDWDRLTARYRARSSTLGRRVRVELGQHELVGTARDVDADGSLVVETDDGARHTVRAGDVIHVQAG